MGTTKCFRCSGLLREIRVCPRSNFSRSSVPEVASQRRNGLSFSDFWSFGADDQGRGVAVASAALRGDFERLKDIFESHDCSIFIQRPGVEEANLPDVLEHWTLREYAEWHFCAPREGQADAAICTPCCCGWRDEIRWRLLSERQGFPRVQLPAVEESVAADRELLQRAGQRGVRTFEKSQMRLALCLHSGRSEFLITRGCLPGLCVLYWRLVL